MSSSDKVGLGIVTYKRPFYLKQVIEHLHLKTVDEIVVVNDGTPYDYEISFKTIQHETNRGVGKSKNTALRHLLAAGCDHLFLMEDDILIKDQTVFQKYIHTSKVTGIQHFNFSQHGLMNKKFNAQGESPNPHVRLNYTTDVSVDLFPHCVGALSYYTKRCIDRVGLIDENYFNACEHVDHTYEIIKHGMHPPFWWFADIAESHKYIADIPWSRATSTISSAANHQQIMEASDAIFIKKHGCLPGAIPFKSINEVKQSLKEIHATYSNK